MQGKKIKKKKGTPVFEITVLKQLLIVENIGKLWQTTKGAFVIDLVLNAISSLKFYLNGNFNKKKLTKFWN